MDFQMQHLSVCTKQQIALPELKQVRYEGLGSPGLKSNRLAEKKGHTFTRTLCSAGVNSHQMSYHTFKCKKRPLIPARSLLYILPFS